MVRPTKTKSLDLAIKENISKKNPPETESILSELLENRSLTLFENFSERDDALANLGIYDLGNIKKNKTEANTLEKPENKDYEWITINDAVNSITIFESYADKQKRSILDAFGGKSLNWQEIINICNIPQTSCYRKIISLLQTGLLIEDYFINKKGRKVSKYKRTFECLEISINNNRISVSGKIEKKLLNKS